MAVTDRFGAQFTVTGTAAEVQGRIATVKAQGVMENKIVSSVQSVGPAGKTLAEQEKAAQEKAEREKEAKAEAKAVEEKAEMEAQAQQPNVSGPSLEEFTFECPLPEQKDEKMDVDEQLPPSDDTVNEANGSRRSTRSRRSLQSLDGSGAASAIPLPGTSSSRRTQPTGSRPPRKSITPNLVFHTNGLALKTLTNNNTTRNQRYYAQLEMNVIRRAGNRPESPTMKLQTILEKQKGEQDKMRAERARRRSHWLRRERAVWPNR